MNPARLVIRPRFLVLALILEMTAPSIASVSGLAMKSARQGRLALASDILQSDSTGMVQRNSILGLKSERSAFQQSLYGTIIPIPTLILTVPGIWFGPSLGYFYAGRSGRAWAGMGVRTLALGCMISSFWNLRLGLPSGPICL